MRVLGNDSLTNAVWPFRKWVDAFGKRKVKWSFSAFFLLASFFLSRAVLFGAAIPFLLPIWALASVRYRAYLPLVIIGGGLGSLTGGVGQAAIHVLQIVLFQWVIRLAPARKSVPVTAALTVLLVQAAWQLVSYSGKVPGDVWFFVGCETLLTLFMAMFLFSVMTPVHRFLHERWTAERAGAAFIVGAFIITGMGGAVFGYFSLPAVLIHLSILFAVSVGGLAAGTAAALVIGSIVSVSGLSFSGMIALYALTGFCAGAASRLGKIGIAAAGPLASVFFYMYDATLPLDAVHFMSVALATLLFLFIPQRWIDGCRNRVYPDRTGQSERRRRWLEEKMDGQLHDFHQFAHFMSRLVGEHAEDQEADIPRDPPSICHTCFRKDKCWDARSEGIRPAIDEWMNAQTSPSRGARIRAEEKLGMRCVRSQGLIRILEEEYSSAVLNSQLHHGRKMLALQLRDMSRHLNDMMMNMKEEIKTFQPEEEELSNRLHELGIPHFQVDILSEEQGSRKIVLSLPDRKSEWETERMVAERLIMPVLQEMYGEPFEVGNSVWLEEPFPHMQMTFISAVRFTMDYAVVSSSKEGTFHAGDSHEVFHLHDGLAAVILSDGMGSDAAAYRESRKVIRLMRECLNRRMDPETAMHTLHYVMSLKGGDMYATVDLALIDLQEGRLWSWKAGSMTTYISRGGGLMKMEGSTAPFGFLPSFSVDAKRHGLKSGDLIVMMTDGMFAPGTEPAQQERVLASILSKCEDLSPERTADIIMQELARKFRLPADDRTVIVIKVDHTVQKWSIFKPHAAVSGRETVVR
ncbi:SpoIIE family protein phosphatase [Bhargavaea cecembensis]|uniref:SpoIIE family protein phosphatase n=1 Tax=Bhargavaea cecembensis TaxID=394098 RepID=UPI00058E92F6|nr:SpoIIE family protein phosphatase [Bhargavaea cecembensis]